MSHDRHVPAACLWGASALELWRACPHVVPADAEPAPRTALEAPTARTAPRLAEALPWLRAPVHVAVSDAGRRRDACGLETHVLGAGWPRGSVLRVADEVLAASPELCFLQMAAQLSLPELICLGDELCGLYAPASGASGQLARREAPLTDARRLERFLDAAPAGARGRARALRALGHVREGAYSPMEVVVGMLLGLPRRLGGAGLPAPAFNRRVDLDAAAVKIARRSYLVCDLFWPEARLDVEYEGRAYHEGRASMLSDKARSNALRHMGVTTVSFFDDHVRSEEAFEVMTREVARELGWKVRSHSPHDALRRAELRRALLRRPGSAEPRWPGLREDAPLLADVLGLAGA